MRRIAAVGSGFIMTWPAQSAAFFAELAVEEGYIVFQDIHAIRLTLADLLAEAKVLNATMAQLAAPVTPPVPPDQAPLLSVLLAMATNLEALAISVKKLVDSSTGEVVGLNIVPGVPHS